MLTLLTDCFEIPSPLLTMRVDPSLETLQLISKRPKPRGEVFQTVIISVFGHRKQPQSRVFSDSIAL